MLLRLSFRSWGSSLSTVGESVPAVLPSLFWLDPTKPSSHSNQAGFRTSQLVVELGLTGLVEVHPTFQVVGGSHDQLGR